MLIQINPGTVGHLQFGICANSMRTMLRFSRSVRRYVAGVAAVLFLGCQGMVVVYAHSGLSAGAAQGSCHATDQDADKNTGVYQAQCQYQHTSSSVSGAHIFAAADMPAITARIDRVVAVADSVLPAESPLLRVEPPPLAILHCCLRN